MILLRVRISIIIVAIEDDATDDEQKAHARRKTIDTHDVNVPLTCVPTPRDSLSRVCGAPRKHRKPNSDTFTTRHARTQADAPTFCLMYRRRVCVCVFFVAQRSAHLAARDSTCASVANAHDDRPRTRRDATTRSSRFFTRLAQKNAHTYTAHTDTHGRAIVSRTCVIEYACVCSVYRTIVDVAIAMWNGNARIRRTKLTRRRDNAEAQPARSHRPTRRTNV